MSHTIHFIFLYVLYSGFIPLFFIASAFTFKYNGYKIKRLLIPYIFYAISFLFLSHIIGFPGLPVDYDNILGVLYARCRIFKDLSGPRMLPSVIAPLWFLPAMFSTVLFLHFRKKWVENSKRCVWGGRLLAVLTAIILCFCPIMMPWSIDTSIIHAYILLIAMKYKDVMTKCCLKRFLIVLFIFIITYVINRFPNISISCYGRYNAFSIPLYMIQGFSETYLIICVCKLNIMHKILQPVRYCGRTSLRLMCIHAFILQVILFIFNEKNYYLNVCITFSVVFAINYLIQTIIDKYSHKIQLLKYI